MWCHDKYHYFLAWRNIDWSHIWSSFLSVARIIKGDILVPIPVMFIISYSIPVGDWAAAAGTDANPAKVYCCFN
jgi:hypothetical protein